MVILGYIEGVTGEDLIRSELRAAVFLRIGYGSMITSPGPMAFNFSFAMNYSVSSTFKE